MIANELELSKGTEELGLSLSAGQLASMLQYLALIQKWNRTYNLTAIREEEKVVAYHLMDSLVVLPHLQVGDLIDIGSGAGLPGIPLAIALPERRVVVLDSNHKKGAFLRQAKTELGLANLEVVTERAESYRPGVKFGAAISRAFSDLNTFVLAAAPLILPTGLLMAMKGVYPNEELEQLPASVRVENVIRLTVPGLDAERHLVVLRCPVGDATT